MNPSSVKTILGIVTILLLLLVLQFIYIDSEETFDNNYHDKPFDPLDESESGKAELARIREQNDAMLKNVDQEQNARKDAASQNYSNALREETNKQQKAKDNYKKDLATWESNTNTYNQCLTDEENKRQAEMKLKQEYNIALSAWNADTTKYGSCVNNENQVIKNQYKSDLTNWQTTSTAYTNCQEIESAEAIKEAARQKAAADAEAIQKQMAADAEAARIEEARLLAVAAAAAAAAAAAKRIADAKAEADALAAKLKAEKEAKDLQIATAAAAKAAEIEQARLQAIANNNTRIALVGQAQDDIDMKAKARYEEYWKTNWNPLRENTNWMLNETGRYSAAKLLKSKIALETMRCTMMHPQGNWCNLQQTNLTYDPTYDNSQPIPDMTAAIRFIGNYCSMWNADNSYYYAIDKTDRNHQGMSHIGMDFYPYGGDRKGVDGLICVVLKFIKFFFKENPDLPISWNYFTTTLMYHPRLDKPKWIYYKLLAYIIFTIERDKLNISHMNNLENTDISDAKLKIFLKDVPLPTPVLYYNMTHKLFIDQILKGKPSSDPNYIRVPGYWQVNNELPNKFKPNSTSSSFGEVMGKPNADRFCPAGQYNLSNTCVTINGGDPNKQPGLNKCQNGFYTDSVYKQRFTFLCRSDKDGEEKIEPAYGGGWGPAFHSYVDVPDYRGYAKLSSSPSNFDKYGGRGNINDLNK